MTPTLDELIEQAHESLVRFTADEPCGMVTVRFHVELLKKYLHALQRLREVEATGKDSLTVQPPTEESSATELSPLHKHFMEEFASKAIADAAASLAAKVVVESTAPVKDSLTTDDPTIRNFRITQPRPGVPTVEEVGDDEWCWVYITPEYEALPTYQRYRGAQTRMWPDHGTHWLPYDAIPMPEGHQ